MWFIDLLKLIYEAATAGKIKTLLIAAIGLGLSYGMWHFSKNIPDTAFFVLGISILWGLFSLPGLIKNAIKVDHDSSEAYRDKISPIIRYLMNKTILKLDASRSFVLEGHNGSASLSNLSFLFMDVTYLETNVQND